MRQIFTAFSTKIAQVSGSYWAFLIALAIVIIWALTGRMFNYSDTWQLVINTGTTIVTFLMVFLIQNTQNRDAKAMHLKLDELISAVKSAHNELIDIEHLSDEQLEEIAAYYKKKKEECGSDVISAIAEDVAEKAANNAAEKVKEETRAVAADTAKDIAENNKKVA